MLRRVKPLCLPARLLATGRRIVRRPPTSRSSPAKTAPGPLESDPALAAASADPWTEVKDPTSGQIYYWNRVTNETTALGAPKPTSPAPQPQPQQESLAGSLGRTVAEGFAFGVGSSIARSVVGSMFGGFGGSDDSPSVESQVGTGDDDEWI